MVGDEDDGPAAIVAGGFGSKVGCEARSAGAQRVQQQRGPGAPAVSELDLFGAPRSHGLW